MFRCSSSRVLAAAVAAVLSFGVTHTALAHERGKDRSHAHKQRAPLELAILGTYNTGLGETSAEIVAFDRASARLFVSNAVTSTIDIVDARDPTAPSKIGSIDVSNFGLPNSVAVDRNVVAVAIEAVPKTDPGHVAFYKTNGEFIHAVQVGAQPDMLTFTPDGKFVLTANEGEPSGYGEGHTDPEGSVSIIPMPRGIGNIKKLKSADVRTADFKRFIGQEAELRALGIRIYGPGANAAQDFEPEYLAVADDSRTAYVTLQENNAIAEIDIKHARIKAVRPLGFKDYSQGPYTTATYVWESLPSIGTTVGGQKIPLGGFSGLTYDGTTRDGKYKFVTHTDRGPNAEPTGILRPFLLPQFAPEVVRFTLDPTNGKFELTQRIQLKRPNGSLLTGLPNTSLSSNASQPYNDEVPVDLFGNTLSLDPLGADLEGIVIDADGAMWMVDEYRPAIYKFDAQGVMLARYVPIGTHAAAGKPVPAPGVMGEYGIEALPAVIAQRRQNRGMEALALQGGKIYGFVQSPVRNPATLSNAALNAMRNIRVVEFDPQTLATRQFLYAMDNPVAVNADDTRADKIGDAVATPSGGFLVLERDDDAVPEDALDTITKKIYAFSLGNATDVSGFDGVYPVLRDGVSINLSIDQMTAAELAILGLRPVTKTVHVDLASAGYAGVEKVEGLALLDSGRLAVINDNDFGVAQIAVDTTTGTFTRLPGYEPEPVTLGLISVTGLDASDRDSRINIRNWPVFGMYLPDSMAAYSVKGHTYLVTANEGDAREWPGLEEEARVSALTLDAAVFPTASTLRQNGNLGRLNVTRMLGDANGDGQYEAFYTLGGRSFSIWSADGQQVFDSDADFERITGGLYPVNFNASNSNNALDDRSDNKGPEPEGLAVGKIGNRTYAFIGLERTGGIMMYDITAPHAPVFVDYINNRDFTASIPSVQAGDLGPEGVTFIGAQDSPTGKPMLAVSNEISGTVTLYEVREQE
jgi:hypothetical protein